MSILEKKFGVDFVALAYHLFGTIVGLYRGGADYRVATMMCYECDFRTYLILADLLLVSTENIHHMGTTGWT
jgi:hypothetical protein